MTNNESQTLSDCFSLSQAFNDDEVVQLNSENLDISILNRNTEEVSLLCSFEETSCKSEILILNSQSVENDTKLSDNEVTPELKSDIVKLEESEELVEINIITVTNDSKPSNSNEEVELIEGIEKEKVMEIYNKIKEENPRGRPIKKTHSTPNIEELENASSEKRKYLEYRYRNNIASQTARIKRRVRGEKLKGKLKQLTEDNRKLKDKEQIWKLAQKKIKLSLKSKYKPESTAK